MQLNSDPNSNNSPSLYIWAAVIVSLCVFAYFYRNSIFILSNYWNEYGTYSHGYLTVLLSIFLLYTCVRQARIVYRGPSVVSAVAAFFVSLVWFVGYIADINTIQMLCLPFLVFFTISYFSGLKNYKVLIVPVFILLFTVPIWSVFLPLLQEIAVFTTEKLLSFSKLEYLVVGNRVIFSEGIFQIEESCSGLRFLLVGVLLAVVYGFLNYQSHWSTMFLVLSTMVIMMIGNIIRILLVIWLGVVKGMDYPLVQDHENLGWVLFAFLLIPMFMVARFIDPNIFQTIEVKGAVHESRSLNLSQLGAALLLFLLAISIAPLYAGHLESRQKQVASLITGGFSPSNDWIEEIPGSSKWTPNYNFYSDIFAGQYTRRNQTVALDMRLYSSERPEGELINSNNQIVDKRFWKVVKTSIVDADLGGVKRQIPKINKLSIKSLQGDECLRVWYWFEVGGEVYTTKWQVKLQEAFSVLNGKSGSAITTLATTCNKESDRILEDYLVENYLQIKKLIIW